MAFDRSEVDGCPASAVVELDAEGNLLASSDFDGTLVGLSTSRWASCHMATTSCRSSERTDTDVVTYGLETPVAGFVRGDCNADGSMVVSDAVFLFRYLFLGGPEPPCLSACDADGDLTPSTEDGVYILSFLFLTGAPPIAPFPRCGRGPEGPEGCIEFPPCR